MAQFHTHIIVGGGFAGLSVARQLLLADRPDLRIVLISSSVFFEYHAALYRSANGMSPLEVAIPYREIFADISEDRFVFRLDHMIDLRAHTKEVVLMSGEVLHYDSLTLALGYTADYFGIPGMADYSETLYGMADALALRTKLFSLMEQKQHLSSIVIGGGPTGIETAAALQPFADIFTANKSPDAPRRIDVQLLEAAPSLLPAFDPKLSKAVTEDLRLSGVSVQFGQKISRASKDGIHTEDGRILSADCVIWTAGSRANSFFGSHPELFELSSKGRVVVNESLHPRDPWIYVAGDSADTRYSGTASAAIVHGAFIAADVLARLDGADGSLQFVDQVPPMVVPTGSNVACALVDDILISGEEGWKLRRKLDLAALSAVMPVDVARSHWKRGEDIAKIF